MKKCPLCGKEYESGTKCKSCGILLIDMETNRAVSESTEKKSKRRAEVKSEPKIEKSDPEVRGEEEETKEEPKKMDSRSEQSWIQESVFGTSEKQESSSKSEKKNSNITLNPALAAVGAVVILAAVAAVFIIRGLGQKEEDETAALPVQEKQTEVTDMPEEPELDQEPEPDLSNVTINAYDADYIEISGYVEENAGTLQFVLDTPQNIYLYDNYAQKEEVVEGVSEVSLDPSAPCALEEYEGRQMSVKGDMWKEGSEIVFSPWEVLYAEPEQDDPGIHQYQIVTEDCTWYEALTRCTTQGGYLVRISSAEEYQYIVDMLNNGGYTNIHFYLGGRREDNGTEYYWINDQNQFIGDCLNSSDSWAGSYWYQGEPSFRDTGSDAVGEITENVMNLFCVSGTWYLNDSSDDLAGHYPDLLSGKVGYIIEYEE